MAKAPKKKAPADKRPEQDRICNIVASRKTEIDWGFTTAVQAQAIAAPPAPAGLPAEVDLRKPWWTVGDQGSTGSCVGWSSTDGVARYHFTMAGRLGQAEHLSPRFTWMASKETDEITTRPETFIEGAGTTLKAAMDILRKYGAAPETLLPFQINTNLYLGDENTFYATLATRKIASYFNLKKDVAKWRQWLAAHGPLLVALNVDATWDHATQTQGKLDSFQKNTTRGGHAVAVVGYTKDGRFIIRNSWGTGWGDKGFAYATESYIKDGFFDEAYGVTL
ncbi:C1 family peptidase [Sphingomonas sp.]|uniref:C1 family peptidase n=1 Tax=Sphingomonas sp. TaxID=28214 RepID=UPI001B178A8D|nr:C1 family peptidase [Sphingomonas sp.]MBO9715088.1 C1 family peptidase [Sphingomonas sp.]